jgi:hypothetical protein
MRSKFRWIIVLAFILFATCNKESNNYISHGTITGQDYRMCVCCGGWLITIDDKQYQFDKLPNGSSIDLNTEKYPLAVKLDWQLNTAGCPNTITIVRIAKE